MENTLKMLIKLEEKYEELKRNNNALNNTSRADSLKKLKVDFEANKLEYLKRNKQLLQINNKCNAVNKEIEGEKEKLKGKEDRLYNNCGSDLKMIKSTEKDIEISEINIESMENYLMRLLSKEEELNLFINKLKPKLENLKSQFNSLIDERNKALDFAKDNIEVLNNEIALIEKEIEGELLKKYHSIKKEKGNAIVRVNMGVCEGCKLNLSLITLQKTKANKEIVLCDHCGRIIYME